MGNKLKNKAVNNISDELQKNYKVVPNLSWRLVVFTMTVTFLLTIFIILYDAYNITNNKLKVEANNINNVIDDEFSMIVNSINMNGYINVFEQYLKTSSADKDITKTVYYESTVKMLNNMSYISEEIQTVFVVSFANRSILYSGLNNVYNENYNYEDKSWYNYNEIMKNNAYLSKEFDVEVYTSEKLFGIVKPIVDSMSDEPLGVVVYGLSTNYLERVFAESTKGNESESLIRINDGEVLFTTKELVNDKNKNELLDTLISSRGNIVYRLNNRNLNWNIVSYCNITDVIMNNLTQFIIVCSLFILQLMTFNMFIKRLKLIKVIRTKKELRQIIDLDEIQEEEEKFESLEEIDSKEYEETPIEEVLNSEKKDEN